MLGLDINNFDVIGFYPYPSVIPYRTILNEYDEFFGAPHGDVNVKFFVEKIRQKVKKEQGRDYWDNKIAFKLRHKETGTIIYAGYKDNRYSIGLVAYNMDNRNLMISFEDECK